MAETRIKGASAIQMVAGPCLYRPVPVPARACAGPCLYRPVPLPARACAGGILWHRPRGHGGHGGHGGNQEHRKGIPYRRAAASLEPMEI